MLPPNWFDEHIYEYLELCNKLDASITADIVRRLIKTGIVTDTAKWQILKAQQAGLLYDDIIAEIAKQSDASEQQVRALFEDAGITALQYDDTIYTAAGLSPLPLKQSPALLRALEAGMKKTYGLMQNLTMTTAVASQTTYINACDLAYMQLLSGAFDYQTAIRNAVKSAIDHGATVLYPSGHTDKLDVAVRRALLTGINQTAGKLQEMRAAELGCDLVETTAHSGARPSHAEWQGKVFSYSGKHPKYPDFYRSTGYGTGAGLCGWNCRHSFYPFFEDLSETAYTQAQLNELNNKTVPHNGEDIPIYEATQMQRSMERAIRATRRELAGYDAALKAMPDNTDLKTDFAQASSRLKNQESALKDFCKQTGLYRETNRYQAHGFGRSLSAKATAAQKRVAKRSNNSIIKVKDTTIGKSLGAKAKNYDIVEPDTGDIYHFVEGTRIQNSEVFAGKGTKHPLRPEVKEGLSQQIGGTPDKWQHCKGHGIIDYYGEERAAEVHWFQEETIGKVKFKIKRWEDED